ncbi:ROK family protein [Halodurantibacterium flavum]|uniref:ROK family protein n=1 Tax=Halodurantibacterium flavum TaxID=1382802 RepID=A0ABW4S169_9RHOB
MGNWHDPKRARAVPAPQAMSPPARAALARLLTRADAPLPGAALTGELTRAGWLDAGTGRLDPGAALLFGCDVGGTKTQSVLTDLTGRLLAEVKEPTAPAGGMAVIDQIAGQCADLIRKAGIDPARLRAGAVGVPAAVHPVTARLSRIPNIRGLDLLDLPALLAQRLGVPVALENDVNMAAQGEYWLGHRAESMAFVALGTGVGMGLIVNGRLLRGARGAAGEISALPLGGDPFDAAVQTTGALESAISSRALLAAYEARGGQPGQTLRTLFAAPADAAFARPADAAFAAVLDDLARLLALAVLSVAAVIDPERIVLGGSIGSRPELLSALRHHLDRCMTPAPDCRISALGNRAGAVGAVWSARQRLAQSLAPHPQP